MFRNRPNLTFFVLLAFVYLGVTLPVLLAVYYYHEPRVEAQGQPEFLVRWAVSDSDYGAGHVAKVLHLKTGACFVLVTQGHGSGLAEAPREVCK